MKKFDLPKEPEPTNEYKNWPQIYAVIDTANKWAKEKGINLVHVAGMLAMRTGKHGKPEFLLVKSPHKPWHFPGGKVEGYSQEDRMQSKFETLSAGLSRELQEEIGLLQLPESLEYVNSFLPSSLIDPKTKKAFVIHVLGIDLDNAAPKDQALFSKLVAGSDVHELAWISDPFSLEGGLTENTKLILGKILDTIPARQWSNPSTGANLTAQNVPPFIQKASQSVQSKMVGEGEYA